MNTTNNPLVILIVDDNVDGAQTLCYLLEQVGHDVQCVYDPNTAIERARTKPPDVFILDIGLPTMDGYDLGRKLHKEHPTATYVGHSAWVRNAAREQQAEFSFDDFVQKPVPISHWQGILETIPKRSKSLPPTPISRDADGNRL